ncbi:MAG: putative terminase large subunit [Prokaryotic dsDNA virus sp.]|nr:MAG: putative terminase large subunit [Prokaryotic dsDNA virus sp.]|tara:strand:- start:8556 stop:10172 length:1617 start_codon:yes stop_codon:yes gene_type:complete
MANLEIDFKNPNYSAVLAERQRRLSFLRKNPNALAAAKVHYKNHPWDFITDWGMTFDPRNLERDLPAVVPFILFPRQVETLQWIHERWRNRERALVEKTRDFGLSWLSIAYGCTMWLFWDDYTAGYGSRKVDLVDRLGDPKSIFEKGRQFLRFIPKEFLPVGYKEKEHANFLKITNPENGSTLTGEGGYDIGRGARTSIYFVDEAAFLERQEAADAALSQTTNCQVDISTPNGNGNSFYRKRFSGKVKVLTLRWQDDPRKDQDWYDKQVREQDPVTVAQEIDVDYDASVEGVLIPALYARACIDAHKKLGFEPSGAKVIGFDIMDGGKDWNTEVMRHGSVITHIAKWQHKEHESRKSYKRVYNLAYDNKASIIYDSVGVGSNAGSSFDEFNDERSTQNGYEKVVFTGFNAGSKDIVNPSDDYAPGKTNKDKFSNVKAQSTWSFADRVKNTYMALEEGEEFNEDEMISFDSESIDPQTLDEFISEMSRILRDTDNNGKDKVESKKDLAKRGIPSPNLFDGGVMAFAVVDSSDWMSDFIG